MRRYRFMLGWIAGWHLFLALSTVSATEPPPPAMNAWQAVTLGVVEGMTEYLPVSSTGHLILTQRLLGFGEGDDKPAADAYAVVIQLGAILAVVGLYWPYVWSMVLGLFGKNPAGLRLAVRLLVAFLPAAVVGLIFKDLIKHYLFGMWPVVAAWFVGGLVILALPSVRSNNTQGGTLLGEMTVRQAFMIGCLQCLAMWPGISRSLTTIVGGRLAGLSLQDAVRFSFLLGGLTLTAATVLDAADNHEILLSSYGLDMLILGTVTSFVAAIISVRAMVAWLNRRGLAVFGYYRVVLAIVVSALIAGGFVPSY